MWRIPLQTIRCHRCKEDRAALASPPFRGERGERILSRICEGCWAEWLKHQTLLINHYGLDPRDAGARAVLYQQIDDVLLGDGEARPIDTSQQGSIQW